MQSVVILHHLYIFTKKRKVKIRYNSPVTKYNFSNVVAINNAGVIIFAGALLIRKESLVWIVVPRMPFPDVRLKTTLRR